jgi:hypothetical protein
LNNPHADGSTKKSTLTKSKKGSQKSGDNEIEEEKSEVASVKDDASNKTGSTNASSTKGPESG